MIFQTVKKKILVIEIIYQIKLMKIRFALFVTVLCFLIRNYILIMKYYVHNIF